MTATATTTMATPMPIPAAAPEEMPEAGVGVAAAEVVSPAAADVEVLVWLDVVEPDFVGCQLWSGVPNILLTDDALLVVGVPDVVEVANVVEVETGLDVEDGDGVEDVEGGAVLAGVLVEAGAADDGEARFLALGTSPAGIPLFCQYVYHCIVQSRNLPTQNRGGAFPSNPSRNSSTVGLHDLEQSATKLIKPSERQRQPA